MHLRKTEVQQCSSKSYSPTSDNLNSIKILYFSHSEIYKTQSLSLWLESILSQICCCPWWSLQSFGISDIPASTLQLRLYLYHGLLAFSSWILTLPLYAKPQLLSMTPLILGLPRISALSFATLEVK